MVIRLRQLRPTVDRLGGDPELVQYDFVIDMVDKILWEDSSQEEIIQRLELFIEAVLPKTSRALRFHPSDESSACGVPLPIADVESDNEVPNVPNSMEIDSASADIEQIVDDRDSDESEEEDQLQPEDISQQLMTDFRALSAMMQIDRYNAKETFDVVASIVSEVGVYKSKLLEKVFEHPVGRKWLSSAKKVADEFDASRKIRQQILDDILHCKVAGEGADAFARGLLEKGAVDVAGLRTECQQWFRKAVLLPSLWLLLFLLFLFLNRDLSLKGSHGVNVNECLS